MRRIEIVSHRGRLKKNIGNSYYENNINGLIEANKFKPGFIEVDTRILSDGSVVIAHDPLVCDYPKYKWCEIDTRDLIQMIGRDSFLNISFERFLNIYKENFNTGLIIDVKDYIGEGTVEYYYDLLNSNNLTDKVMIVSWNLKFIDSFIEFQKNKMNKIQLGLSFIPFSISKIYYKPIENITNLLFKDACKSVFIYDYTTIDTDSRLREAGFFPWFVGDFSYLFEKYNNSIAYGVEKFFVKKKMSRLFPSLKMANRNVKNIIETLFLWDFDQFDFRNNFKKYNLNLNINNLLLFTSSLDKISKHSIDHK